MADNEKTDIVPELLEQIQKDFDDSFAADPMLRALSDKISAGKASYVDAEEFAARTGELLAAALQKNISAERLPNGKMYYNIAERVLGTMLRADHEIIAGMAAEVQRSLNERAGLGLKPQVADYDSANAQSIIDKVSAADDFNARSWMLEAPVVSFSMKVVDDTVKKNADFHYRSGLKPRIIRSAEAKCCDWCASLEGTYEYPGVSRDVFRRHNNCRCTVDYDPRSGKVQNVWNKKEWKDAEEYDKIEARKEIWPEDDRNPRKLQMRSNLDQYYSYTRRKYDSKGNEAIDKRLFNELVAPFVKNGGIIDDSEDAQKHLGFMGAEAAYLPGFNTILFRPNPTVSDVLEELFHWEQDTRGDYNHDGISLLEINIRREIDTQNYLLFVAKEKYNIPEKQTAQTIRNLKGYIDELKVITEGKT